MKNKIDRDMMEEALREAERAFEMEEVPVGAVITLEGKIIARACNEIESRQDPSAHAELLCIRRAARALKNWRLLGTTLYTTLEPCPMCAGALFLARVERVVWGAPDLRAAAERRPSGCLLHGGKRCEGGVLEERSIALIKQFFKKRRGESGKD